MELFADGSSWDKIIPLLLAKGLKVVSVQNLLASLAKDVAYTQRRVDAQSGKVVLVGHSWGGSVITQAGNSDKIKALAYIAALVPSESEASAELGKNYPTPPGIEALKPDSAGYLYLSEESLAKNFAQDLSKSEVKIMSVTQRPILTKAFGEKVSYAA